MFTEFMVVSSFIIFVFGIWEVDAQAQDDWSAQTQSASVSEEQCKRKIQLYMLAHTMLGARQLRLNVSDLKLFIKVLKRGWHMLGEFRERTWKGNDCILIGVCRRSTRPEDR
jgi:hypothetical protein